MRIIQNGYNQKRNAYDQTEFFICTHNYHPPSTGFSEWVGARPPATRVNTVFSFSPAHCGAGRDFVHRLYNRLLLPLTAFSTFFTSNVCPVSPNSKEYIV